MARWRPGVPVLHYVDQRADSAEREIEFRWKAMQDEIDRRVHSVEASALAAAGELSKRLDGMNDRLDRVEATQDRARGRQAAYAAIAAVAGVLVTIFIIVAGHIHVS